MNAKELAKEFGLEELRDAFDAIETATFVLAGSYEAEFEIGGRKVRTTPNAIGDAKLVHRGWLK